MAWDTGTGRMYVSAENLGEKGRGVPIHLSNYVYKVIKTMCRKYEHMEWQMMLTGKEEDGKVFVEGYYIPQQRNTGSSVRNLESISREKIDELGIVATIHSHCNMGVYFSSTDINDTVKGLIRHHLIVNNSLEFAAGTQLKLPNCEFTLLFSNVYVGSGEDDVEIEGLYKIETETLGFGVSWLKNQRLERVWDGVSWLKDQRSERVWDGLQD